MEVDILIENDFNYKKIKLIFYFYFLKVSIDNYITIRMSFIDEIFLPSLLRLTPEQLEQSSWNEEREEEEDTTKCDPRDPQYMNPNVLVFTPSFLVPS